MDYFHDNAIWFVLLLSKCRTANTMKVIPDCCGTHLLEENLHWRKTVLRPTTSLFINNISERDEGVQERKSPSIRCVYYIIAFDHHKSRMRKSKCK